MDQPVLAYDGTRDALVPIVHDLMICPDASHGVSKRLLGAEMVR
jgi:hypothetical protein